MVKSTKEALCELKRYIHTVECNGALLASKNSSFINDYLRAFVANNTVPRNDKASMFSALPSGVQCTIVGFLNAESIINLSLVNKLFHNYIRTEKFDEKLKANYGSFVQSGDSIDAQDIHGNWFRAIVRNSTPQRLLIHYKGWSDKWDEWIKKKSEKQRIAPLRTKSKNSHAMIASNGIILVVTGLL